MLKYLIMCKPGNRSTLKAAICNMLHLVFVLPALVLAVHPPADSVLKVKCADDYPPFEFLNEDGQPDGYNIELFKAVADHAGLSYTIETGRWEEILVGLEKGRIDILTGIYYSPSRARWIAFSSPYETVSYTVFVPDGSQIDDIHKLIGKTVLVVAGGTSMEYVRRHNLTDKIVAVSSAKKALLELKTGHFDCAILPREVGLYLLKQLKIDKIHPLPMKFNLRTMGFGVRIGEKELIEKLNIGLDYVLSTGMEQEIYGKWIKNLEEKTLTITEIKRTLRWVALVIMAAGGLAFFWVLTLRIQLKRQTSNLHGEISTREKVQEILRLERSRYEMLFENAPEAIALVRHNGEIIDINNHFTELFGYNKQELMGRNIDDLLPPDNKKHQGQEITRRVAEGEIVVEETIRKRKDGRGIDVSLLAVGFDAGPDQESVIYAIYRDISKRKKTEIDLQEANIFKELLIDIIAHDLKNPIGVILGFTDILKDSHPDDEIISTLNDSAQEMLKVIDTTTILSRIVSGSEIPKEKIGLRALVDDTIRKNLYSAQNTDIKITNKIPDTLIAIANPIIAEIFKNYITNAIKYAAEGGSVVINDHSGGGKISISVDDLGETIDKKHRKIIFARGYQIKSGSSRGSGLGLAIVDRIARSHNGRVWVEPNKPRGNRFFVEIPRHPEEHLEQDLPE